MYASLELSLPVEPREIERLLTLSITDLKNDPVYQELLAGIDAPELNRTLKEAKRVLSTEIPPIVDVMKAKYKLDDFPLTAFMLSNWILGYLGFPDELWNLPRTHTNVPVSIIREVIPKVHGVFGQMESGAQAWQRAFATLVIPLASSGR